MPAGLPAWRAEARSTRLPAFSRDEEVACGAGIGGQGAGGGEAGEEHRQAGFQGYAGEVGAAGFGEGVVEEGFDFFAAGLGVAELGESDIAAELEAELFAVAEESGGGGEGGVG